MYPGQDFRQGGTDFFWEKKGRLIFFLGEKTFFGRKKGGDDFFGGKRGGKILL